MLTTTLYLKITPVKMSRLKITGNSYKDNPFCPCGKGNKDYRFTTYIGFENKQFSFCNSCDKDFKNNSIKAELRV